MKNKSKEIIMDDIDLSQPIFKFINPSSNDVFLNLDNKDIKELVTLLSNYCLEFRKRLGFSEKITFGIEIEFEKKLLYKYLSIGEIKKEIYQKTNQESWYIGYDASLKRCGLEATSPIYRDKENTWQKIKDVCIYLRKISYVDEFCGGHIHIGTQILGNDLEAWNNFFKLWIVYEDIISRFVCGEYLTFRPSVDKWAPPLSTLIWESYQYCKEKFTTNFDRKYLNEFFYLLSDKKQAISFQNVNNLDRFKVNNTIEFRSPNGTLDPVIWQNNINFILNILNSVKKPIFNDSLVYEKYLAISRNELLNNNKYKKINLPKALELSDLIFDNNLDKLYFLKQYLKNFKEGKDNFKKSPVLTKKISKY